MGLLSSIPIWWSSFLAHLFYNIDGAVHSGLASIFWIRPKWGVASIPDLTGRVYLVTGGNSGTGYATCKAIYDAGGTVYLAARSEVKAREAMRAIEQGAVMGYSGLEYPSPGSGATPRKGQGRLEFLELDLADLRSVDRAVRDFTKKETRLDVLFANAGVMASPAGLYTSQGYTLQFGTNVLGHHHLITQLLPLLLSTSRSNPSDPPRVILLSSQGHALAPKRINYEEMFTRSSPLTAGEKRGRPPHKAQPGKGELSKWAEYGASKWGDIALARWLHWRHGPGEGAGRGDVGAGERDAELIAIAIHPGFVGTNLFQHQAAAPAILKYFPWLLPLVVRPPSDGALNQLWAGLAPPHIARSLSGHYIVPFQHVGRARPDLEDIETVEACRRWCEEQVRKWV